MKPTLITAIVLATLSTGAVAGVKEKKAMRAADAKVAEQIVTTKQACGNTQLDVTIDWEKFNIMIAENETTLKEKRYQEQWVLSHAGDRTASVIEALGKICNSDADYKEELAKLTKVVVHPLPKFSDYRSSFKLDGTTIQVASGHYMTRNADDYTKPIKALF